MDAVAARPFAGPMVVLTWLVAIGWAVLAVACGLGLRPPVSWGLAALGAGGALVTAWLALSLRVHHDAEGVTLPRVGRVGWADVRGVEVRAGVLSVPYVVVQRGRRLEDVPLDGLAWFGGPDGLARELAERVARAADVEVSVQRPRTTPGRRAL